MRLAGKVAIVVGAGQRPGATIGNGRATAIAFAREGARVLAVDREPASGAETCAMIAAEGGTSVFHRADVTIEDDCASVAAFCMEHYGRIDILQNNVGIILPGDRGATSIDFADWQRILDVNLTGMLATCKHVLPHMRRQRAGAITNISSSAAVLSVGMIAYKVSKAGVNALTHSVAMANAQYGVRANAIMPGLLDTPMAIEGREDAGGGEAAALRAERNRLVPLNGRMGDAWDTAHASVFLASDEAKFITGVVLPVDGGQTARIGL